MMDELRALQAMHTARQVLEKLQAIAITYEELYRAYDPARHGFSDLRTGLADLRAEFLARIVLMQEEANKVDPHYQADLKADADMGRGLRSGAGRNVL